jgi:hypothetical protein
VSSEPLLFTKNYVDDEALVTVSHGDGSKGYLFDRDQDSKWTTSGANSDATEVSVAVEFYESGVAVSRTIDRILLINHNLKDWHLDYWDGSAWVLLLTVTADALGNTLKTLSSTATTKVRLRATATQIADAEKFVGEMVVCALLVDPGRDVEPAYAPRWRELTAELVMGEGSLHRVTTRWAQNRVQRYEASVTFSFLNSAARDALKAVRDDAEPFLWYPESVTRPAEIYLVFWSAPWAEKYVSSYKGAGSQVTMEVREV